MNKQQTIDRFQDRYANKELSFGCLMEYPKGMYCEKKSSTSITFYNKDTKGWMNGPKIKHQKAYNIKEEDIKIIGHPLNRGQLVQGVCNALDNVCDKIEPSNLKKIKRIRTILIHKKLLGETIYERVEVPEILSLLTELKELIEKE